MPEYGTAISSRAGVRSPGKVPGKDSGIVSGRYENWVGEPSQEERSKDRLSQYGPKHLTNTELVAILLWSGLEGEDVFFLASRLLSRLGGLGGLGRTTFADLCDEISAGEGMREAKACQLLAALELGRRFVTLAPASEVTVNSPEDVVNLVGSDLAGLDQEHLQTVLLNTQNQVMSIQEIYVGNVNSSVVRPVEVFRPAIRENAPSIIVVHNHPSGDPTPSPEDVLITNSLVAAGQVLGIALLDHVIIGGDQRFVSLNQQGLGFA